MVDVTLESDWRGGRRAGASERSSARGGDAPARVKDLRREGTGRYHSVHVFCDTTQRTYSNNLFVFIVSRWIKRLRVIGEVGDAPARVWYHTCRLAVHRWRTDTHFGGGVVRTYVLITSFIQADLLPHHLLHRVRDRRHGAHCS